MTELNWKLMAPLGQVTETISKVRDKKSSVKGLHDITSADLEAIRLELDEETEIGAQCFDVGTYFNSYARNIILGAVPSGSLKSDQEAFTESVLLLAFVRDFKAIFDSTNAILAHRGQEEFVDLSDTLQYKLLITCGTFLKVNKQQQPPQESNWIKETRSVKLDSE